MKIVIIPDDKLVGVDGEFTENVDFTIDADIHALHWDGTAGVIEYKSKTFEVFDDIAPYMHIVDAKYALDKVHADTTVAESEAMVAEEVAQRASAETAMTPIDKRRAEYPSIETQLEALYDARQGDSTTLLQLDALIQAARNKYPL